MTPGVCRPVRHPVRAAVATLMVLSCGALAALPSAAATATDPTPLGSRPGLAPDRAAEPLAGERAVARASTAPQTRFQMPFPCGQSWNGSTRDSHSPSRYSVDWNRTDDEDDPVVASAPGVVTRAERWTTSYGHWVMIEHPSGETTIYAHMNAVTVAVGQTVDQGTQVGTVGNTGNSFGAHLHFEERTSSGSVRWPWFDGSAFSFGTTPASRNCVDVPLAGNFLRDGKAEVAVFRRGAPSQFRIQRPDRGPKVVSFGSSTDQPVVGDWDGDGTNGVSGRRAPGPSRCGPRRGSPASSSASRATCRSPATGTATAAGRWAYAVPGPAGSSSGPATGPRARSTSATSPTCRSPGTGTATASLTWVSTTRRRRCSRSGWWTGTALTWTAEVPFGTRGDLPVTGDWDANGLPTSAPGTRRPPCSASVGPRHRPPHGSAPPPTPSAAPADRPVPLWVNDPSGSAPGATASRA